MNFFEPLVFRQHFPLLDIEFGQGDSQKFPLIYFDNGATTQKPQSVIDSYQQFYCHNNANVHRSSHSISTRATTEFEHARVLAKNLINAKHAKEVIWTKGTTESINLIAHSYARHNLNPGDEIILSQCEHHANIVPWQIAAQLTGAVIKVLALDEDGFIDVNSLERLISNKTKIVSCTHISNVLGRINPIKEIIVIAKKVGAITVIDGAQAIAHLSVDVQSLDCDFYAFSAHKMYGPTGVGVLYGKEELLSKMLPYQSGGEMINQVSFEKGTSYNELPFKFEAGTPNIAGVIAFSKAIDFINAHFSLELIQYERSLIDYTMQQLTLIPEVHFVVQGKPDIPVISFIIKGHHNHDVASTLDSFGIAVRSGHHCAMPLMDYLAIKGCLRISLAAYNTFEEINYFIDKLKEVVITDNSIVELDKSSDEVLINSPSDKILALFENCKGWDGRHRQIMLLSKQLKPMPDECKHESSLIKGCESLAWLTFTKDSQGNFFFHAFSDAKVIRGLLVIVLAAFNHKNSQQIEQFDLENYFNKLGLIKHLSPSRGNGVRAIVDKIKSITQ